ncbi:hypothetical protein D3C87_1173560 [compost metagenome]
MKKLIAFFGLMSISLTTVAALAQSPQLGEQVSPAVSHKALASLIKHSRTVKLVGDVSAENPQKITDILAALVLTSSDSVFISNTCVVATDGAQQVLNCELERHTEIADQVLRYSVKIEITNEGINVLGLNGRKVTLISGT